MRIVNAVVFSYLDTNTFSIGWKNVIDLLGLENTQKNSTMYILLWGTVP